MKIKNKHFSQKEFKTLSWDKNGLTNLGFKQYLFRNFEQDRIEEMLQKLGYDQGLYSLKSRVFVASFQSENPIAVKINDSILGDMHRRAWDLYMNKKLMENEISQDFDKTSQYVFLI